MKTLLIVLVGVCSPPLAVLGALVMAASPPAVGSTPWGTAAPAVGAIPPAMLDLYAEAAPACPGLAWQILAAIGTVESSNGTSELPGVHSGHNGAGAEGPMQFEPATFSRYALPVPQGGARPPSPYDPTDAVWAAARFLCANGAGSPEGLGAALYAYDHSDAYAAHVLAVAGEYGFVGGPDPGGGGPAPGGVGPAPSRGGAVAVEYALAQVGTPYRWGGETAGVGFDCSGLAQAAWAAAGVPIPRVAADQWEVGRRLGDGEALAPGDLVFFAAGGAIDHVGLVLDPRGVMVDAPHAGSFVRVEPFPTVPGELWGGERYIGATTPG